MNPSLPALPFLRAFLCAFLCAFPLALPSAQAGRPGKTVAKGRRTLKLQKVLGIKRSPTAMRDASLKESLTIRSSDGVKYLTTPSGHERSQGYPVLRIERAGNQKVAIAGRRAADGYKEFVLNGGQRTGNSFFSLKPAKYTSLLVGQGKWRDGRSYYSLVSPKSGVVIGGVYNSFTPLKGTDFLAGKTSYAGFALIHKDTGKHLGNYDSISVKNGKLVLQRGSDRFFHDPVSGQRLTRAWDK